MRAPRHRSARGRDRARSRGRRDPERGRHDPRRGQQVRGRGDARGHAPGSRREPPARGHRASVHAEGGGGASRRRRLRPGAAPGACRLRLRPGGSDRRGDPRRAVRALDGVQVPRPRGALRHVPRGRPVGDRGGVQGDLRSQAGPGGRGVVGERRADQRRDRRQHRAGVVHVPGRGALSRR